MSNSPPPPTNDRPPPRPQPNNPLHGMTLEAILTALVAHYGWEELAARLRLRCFAHEPSLSSSLKFLRKTPWARAKVEGLYLFMRREQRRGRNGPEARMAPKPEWHLEKAGTPAT